MFAFRPPLLALGAVLALKLAVVMHLADHPLLQADAGLDTTLYLDLARRVVAGNLALTPGLYFVSPLYIYFTAAVLAVADSMVAIRIVQAALGTAAVALVFTAAREWFGPVAAWSAAALAALTGLFTFYETLLLQAALDPFLTAAALAALAFGLRRGSAPWLLVAGAVFGLHSLNRPNILVPTAALIVLLLLRRPRAALLLALGTAVALAPLLVRNIAVTGEWSLLASHGGLNFYIGNHAGADGTYRHVPGITPNMAGQQSDARRVAEGAVGRPLSDADVSAHFYRLGWSWIRENPGDAARLFGRKLRYTLSSNHLWLNYSYPFFADDTASLLRIMVVGPWLLIPLGLTGLALPLFGSSVPPQHRVPYLVWASFVPLYAIGVALFFVAERYRLPLLIPVCIGSGALVSLAIARARSAAWRSLCGPALAVAAIAVVVNWPLGLDDGRAEQRLRMAERLIARGDVQTAEQWTDRALELHQDPGLVHLRVGRSLLARRKLDRAIPHLEQAATAAPGRPEPAYALGQALLDAGRAAEAVPHLRTALAGGTRLDLAGYDLARALATTGERAEALRVLRSVRPAQPDDAASWLALGRLAQQLDAPALAAGFYRESARAAPKAPEPHAQLGLMLAVTRDFAAAARAFESAAALAPKDPSIRLNLAVAYAALGRVETAKRSAQEALRLDPSYKRARDFLDTLDRVPR